MAGEAVSGRQEIEDMIPPKRMTRVLGILTAVILATGVAMAVDPETAKLRGYVDGAPFLELAGEDGELVEVSLPRSILGMFCGTAEQEEPDVAGVACGLEWIGAVVVGIGEQSGSEEQGRELIEQTEKRLLGKGWERLVRVQEEDEILRVLMLPSGRSVLGLVVLIVEEDEIIFANVAGNIDMAQLHELADTMDIPGLEELPSE
jgi:hypothetical protein